MEVTLLSFSSIFLATLIFMFLLKFKTQNTQLSLPPGPMAFPFVGCLPQLIMNKPVFRWIHNYMDNINTEIACFRFGKVHVIVVTSPKLACEFLKKEDANFSSRPVIMSSDLTSEGYLGTVLSPFGNQWKKMRKIVSSEILSSARHRWLQEKRVEEADHLVRCIYIQCMNCLDGGIVNIRVLTQHYCGNVIRKLMFSKRFFGKGMKDGGAGAEEVEHVDALFTILAYVYAFCLADYLPFLRRYDLDGHEKILKKALQAVKRYHDPIIDERITQWKDGTRKEEEDLLDVLICLRDSKGSSVLSVDEIKAQINELVLAAVDNPSNAIEWALAEMLNQPKLLERATKELDHVVGKDRLVQESDLPQLNYITACAKEAFRLHPVAPFNLPHVAINDKTVAGYQIPKGTHVLLSRPGLGRNPRFWEDPYKFMPERHLKARDSLVVLTDSELKILSFSIGRRGCAGVALGSDMTAMLLARLLQGFTWGLPPGMNKVDLYESESDLFLAKPLLAFAKPRLACKIYPTP